MIKYFLTILCLVSSLAFAEDFSEIVEKYKVINQEKIKVITAHRNRIKGVEIIVADRAENIASRFGHGLLRLVDDDNSWFNDPVISFSALSYDKNYSIRKSIFGGYEVTPQVQTLYEFWKQYTENEERDLKRFVINLNGNDLDKFLDTLFKFMQEPELLDDYKFLSNNCIGVITKIFVKAGLTQSNKIAKIPSKVSGWIEKNNLSLYPDFVMKNHAQTKRKMEELDLNEMSNQEIQKEFSPEELHYIYFNNNLLTEEKVDFLAGIIKEHSLNLNDTFSFAPVHFTLYSDIQNEQQHLRTPDLLRTIVYRLERGMDTEVKHLSFKKETIARINISGYRYLDHKEVSKHGKTYIEINLRSTGHENDYVTERIELEKDQKNVAVIKIKNSLEILNLSL
ncbi:MAG: DUF4105 domain-containing protein [Bacteriovoracia bacterium]